MQRITTTLTGLIAIIAFVVIMTGCPAKQETPQPPAPEPEKVEQQAAVTFACPMHPYQTSTEAGTKCPECNMDMIPMDQITPGMTIYTCPMHPDQHSIEAGAVCPICGGAMEPMNPPAEPAADGTTESAGEGGQEGAVEGEGTEGETGTETTEGHEGHGH